MAIASALVRVPAAYLVDDPISALDTRLREEMCVELKRIQRELGKTLIYVTHDQEEAMSIADRMAILEEGAISQVGTPVEIHHGPANECVARLLGSPMNIVPALLDASRNSFEAAGSAIRLPAGVVPEETSSLGIRSENLRSRRGPTEGAQPVTVFEVEPLGGHTVVTLEAGGQMLKVLMRGQPQIAADSLVTLTCSPEQMHFFGASGETLAR